MVPVPGTILSAPASPTAPVTCEKKGGGVIIKMRYTGTGIRRGKNFYFKTGGIFFTMKMLQVFMFLHRKILKTINYRSWSQKKEGTQEICREKKRRRLPNIRVQNTRLSNSGRNWLPVVWTIQLQQAALKKWSNTIAAKKWLTNFT